MKPELNFPNIITASRILLTPVFIWLLVSNDAVFVQLSAAVFLIAAVSDWYDGWYARRYNAMSAFGRFFDPLADKVLIGAAFFAFAFMNILPLWMVVIIVARDVLLTVLRVIADRKGQPVVTSRLAKWKTAFQLIFLWYIVAALTAGHIQWLKVWLGREFLSALFSPLVILIPMILLTALSVITAVQYLIENRHVFTVNGNKNFAGTPS